MVKQTHTSKYGVKITLGTDSYGALSSFYPQNVCIGKNLLNILM